MSGNLRGYLEALRDMRSTLPLPTGFSYTCSEDYVLDRGTVGVSDSLTPAEAAVLWEAIDRYGGRFQQRQCFYNAQMVTISDQSNRLQYVEGYAVGGSGMAVHHGWVTLNTKVIDLTWRTPKPNHAGRLRNRIVGVVPNGWEYLGVHFAKPEIVSRIVESSMVEAFIGDYRRNFPNLKSRRQSAPNTKERLE